VHNFTPPDTTPQQNPLAKSEVMTNTPKSLTPATPPDKREVASAEVNSPVSSLSAPKSKLPAAERLGEGAGNRNPGEGEAKETNREDKFSVRSRAF